MKRVFALFSACTIAVALVGCGDAGPTNSVEGVQQNEVDDYNALLAADEAAMAEEDASGGTTGDVPTGDVPTDEGGGEAPE